MTPSTGVRSFAEYLTVGQAAAFLGVSPWTLRNWDNSGKLKSIRHPVSGYRMYRPEDLEALLQTGSDLGVQVRPLTPKIGWGEIGEREHFVQFYESDEYLVGSVSAYIGPALTSGGGGIVIATPEHLDQIHRELERAGIDVSAAELRGQYLPLDARATLAQFMVNDSPDSERFERFVAPKLEQVSRSWPRVRTFGEMVSLLWEAGNQDAACELETLWNKLAQERSFALFCAYPLDNFQGESDGRSLSDICALHTRVIPAESYALLATPEERLEAIAALQAKVQRLETEIAARQAAERECADFVENALEGLHKVGPDGTILWANKAELEMLGFAPDEYIGHRIAEFHVDRDAIDDILRRLLSGENLLNQPAQLRCKDGAIKKVLIHSNAFFENGEFVYSRCFTRDVTNLNQLEYDQAVLASIIESSEDAIVSKTLDGTILSWNAGAERLFGYSESEAVGQAITLIIPPEKHSEEAAILERLRCGERIEHYETVRVAKDGRRIDISLTISPVRDSDGNLVGASKVARDITDRKRAEQALRDAYCRKDEFLATLAHELRNPLAPIRNGLQLLRLTTQDNPAAVRVHDMMERQVNHMVRLVDDLLELSRISRGTIELRQERLQLETVLNHALETSRPLIDAGGHALYVSLPESPVLIEGDLVRLSQVFSNLLTNAAKYTDHGGTITVTAKREPGSVVVTVSDTGIGIPPDMLTKIFEMFAQVENPLRRSQEGLGIGLNLVRTLITMHGGRVEAHSEGLGHGSRFEVRLPTMADSDVLEREPPATSQTRSAELLHRILAVDDNKDSADSIGAVLRFMGADVQTAYDGPSALQAVRTYRPSIVLMDIGMPGMDGCEVARQIRQDPGNRDMLLIAITGWGQEDDRRRSREAGFDHHLVKPIDIDALQALLESPTR